MQELNSLKTLLPQHDLTFLAGVPYVYHCHHFNLFHDQTISDVLGEERGLEFRSRAAHRAFSQLLDRIFQALGTDTPPERFEIAARLFAWMGQGKMEFSLSPEGGTTRGMPLHYSFAWKQKYGSKIRCRFPVDAVGAGFSAAIGEAGFNLEPGSFQATETTCIAQKHTHCGFTISAGGSESAKPLPVQQDLEQLVGPSFPGEHEGEIVRILAPLREFLAGVAGDERGLIQAFNIFAAAHLTAYYNRTAFGLIHHLESGNPKMLPIAVQLLREAGRVCVFNTFGNLMLSPEWEGLASAPSGAIEETVLSCMTIARGLGFGHWTIKEIEPSKRFVLQTPSNYESPFYIHQYGTSEKARCYFLQGAAHAIMLLAHEVDWKARPELTEELYFRLFHGSKTNWVVEETRCRSQGNPLCEVVVTHR